MGHSLSCFYCGDIGNDYHSPLLTIHHRGKYNGLTICSYCWDLKRQRRIAMFEILERIDRDEDSFIC